jgi:hypothetical protein
MGKLTFILVSCFVLMGCADNSGDGSQKKSAKKYSQKQISEAVSSLTEWGGCLGEACNADLTDSMNQIDIDTKVEDNFAVRVRSIGYGFGVSSSASKSYANAALSAMYGMYGIDKQAQSYCKDGGHIDKHLKSIVTLAQKINDKIVPLVKLGMDLSDAVSKNQISVQQANQQWEKALSEVNQFDSTLIRDGISKRFNKMVDNLNADLGNTYQKFGGLKISEGYENIGTIVYDLIGASFKTVSREGFKNIFDHERSPDYMGYQMFENLLNFPLDEMHAMRTVHPETIMYFLNEKKPGEQKSLLQSGFAKLKLYFGPNDLCFSKNCQELLKKYEQEFKSCLNR